MFGRLVSTTSGRSGLEFVETPDRAAAVSRSVRDEKRIACLLCRSKKVRCSGGWNKCQRCEAMDLRCVYPASQGWIKRRGNRKGLEAMAPGDSKDDSMSKNGDENSSDNGSNSMASNTSRPHQSSGGWGVPETALSDLSNDMFDDSFIDESLFSSWATDDEGMQHALYGPIDFGNNAGPASAATANTTDLAFSTLNVPHGHPGLLSPADSTLATAVDQASDSELCGALQPASTNPCSKVSFKLDGCSCLLRLISVLEKLAVKSASRVDRIDLLLADVRYSIGTLAEIVSCASCVAQAERNTLLAIATQRISVICGKMAICLQCLHGACPATSSSNLLSPGEIDETSAEEGNVDMSISSYRVTQRERLHLLRSLVAFQIEEFEKQFQLIKSCSHRLPSREQATALAEAEDRIILARAAVSGSLLPTIQGRD